MKLLTKEIEARLPAIGATDGLPLLDHVAQAKFFTPDANWTWYVVEGERRKTAGGEDWLFFGYVIGLEREWGYFTLSELEGARGPLGLRVERDLHFEPKRMGEIVDDHVPA